MDPKTVRGYFREEDGKYYHEGGDPEFVCSNVVNGRDFDLVHAGREAAIARLRVVSEEKATLLSDLTAARSTIAEMEAKLAEARGLLAWADSKLSPVIYWSNEDDVAKLMAARRLALP